MCHACSHRVLDSLRCIDDDLRYLETKKSKLLAKKMRFARLVQHCCQPCQPPCCQPCCHPVNHCHQSNRCHPGIQCQPCGGSCNSFCGKKPSCHNCDPCHVPCAEDDPRIKYPPGETLIRNLKNCLSVFDSERLLLITEKMKVVYVLEDCNHSFSSCPDATVRDVLKKKIEQKMNCMRDIDDRLCEFEDRRANYIADNMEKFGCPCFKLEPNNCCSPCSLPPSVNSFKSGCGPCCNTKPSCQACANHHNNHSDFPLHSNYRQHSNDLWDLPIESKVYKSTNLEAHGLGNISSIEGAKEIDSSEIGDDLMEVDGSMQIQENKSRITMVKSLISNPGLTREGFEHVLQHIEIIAIGDNNNENSSLIYRSGAPSLPIRNEILSAANKGSSLWHMSPVSITMVMTDQLIRMVRTLSHRCILTDSVLKTRCPTFFKITSMVSSESCGLWQRLFTHMMRVVTSHSIKIETLADLFSPILIHPSSRMFIQAASLISKLLHDEINSSTHQDSNTFKILPLVTSSNTSHTIQKMDTSNDSKISSNDSSLHEQPSDLNKDTQDMKEDSELVVDKHEDGELVVDKHEDGNNLLKKVDINNFMRKDEDGVMKESEDDITVMKAVFDDGDCSGGGGDGYAGEERNEDDGPHSTRGFCVTSSLETFSLTQTAAYQNILTESLVSPLRLSDSDGDDDDDVEKNLNQLISCNPLVMET